jgi:site-specific DNA recombinase
MKIALYSRVSTERQVEQGISMEDREAAMAKWVRENGHVIVEVFREPGASAYSLEKRRPVFDRMISAALSPEKPFDIILVHMQNRFYRRNADREILERQLEKNGVKLMIFGQPRSEGKTTAFIERNFTGLFDEAHSMALGEKVAQCMKANAEAGYYNGARPPYGYKTVATDIPARSGVKKLLAVDDEEAETVRLIFRLARFGDAGMVMGMKRIAEHLNARGILHRGVKWTIGHVEKVLENPVCMGTLITFRRNSQTNQPHPRENWVETKVPPILTEGEFKAVHGMLTKRRPPNTENRAAQVPTLLTGLLVCGYCKKGLMLVTGKSGRYKYYRCASRQKVSPTECCCPNFPKEAMETQVLEAVVERVLSPTRVTSILGELEDIWKKAKKPDPKRIQRLQTRSAALRASLGSIYGQLDKRTLDLDVTLQEYIRAKQRERETVDSELSALEARQHLPFKKVGRAHIEKFVAAAKRELCDPQSALARQLLRALVTDIRVDGAKCRIRGNRAQLASAVTHWNSESGEVPSDVSDWCARLGSNQQPLPSEGSTLSIELRARNTKAPRKQR